MCGLVGIIGDIYTNDVKVFKQLMHVNYLRGVHATGFVNVRSGNNDNLTFKRAYNPIELFDMKSADSALSISGSQALLGHCRQATVGASGSHQNAHPFTHGAVTMMHNGTLTSRTGLLGTGFAVDSEQICHTLSELNEDDEIKTMLEEIDGAFALVWADERDETINIARNDERTLFFAISNVGKFYYASEKEMLELVLNRNGITLEGEIQSVPVGTWFQIPQDPKKYSELQRVEFTPRPKRTWTTTTYGTKTTTTGSTAKTSTVVQRSAKIPLVQQEILDKMDIKVEAVVQFSPYQVGTYPNTNKFVAIKGTLLEEPFCDVVVHGIPADAQIAADAADKNSTKTYDCKVIGVSNATTCNQAKLETVELACYQPIEAKETQLLEHTKK